MGKNSILMLTFMIFNFGLLFSNLNRMNMYSIDNLADYQSHTMSKKLAQSALQYWLMRLNEDNSLSGQYVDDGDFIENGVDTVRITNNGSGSYTVDVAAWYFDSYSSLSASISMSVGMPEMMEYAILSGGNLTINGNKLVAAEDAGNNANIHTNSNLTISGNRGVVRGFGSWAGSGSASPSRALTNTFTPNSNPNSLPVSGAAGAVAIPALDADALKATADVTNTSNVTVSGSQVLGSPASPMVWYVGGDLTISGTFTGNGIFVVKGNIIVSGNTVLSGFGHSNSKLGLYAEGDVTISGSSTVEAQIFSNSNVTLNGTPTIYGNIVAKGIVNLNGTPDIYYRPAAQELTEPAWTSSDGLQIVSIY